MASVVLRLQRDLRDLDQLGFNSSAPPIFVAPVEDRITHLRTVILGPTGTPYADGFFIVDLKFGEDYPNTAPTATFMSTDGGSVRMNPNLYANGKVCLSILGTWTGSSDESWRSTYSVGYLLQCIQALILNAEPYFNEPGFEKSLLETKQITGPHWFGLKIGGATQKEESPSKQSSNDGDDDDGIAAQASTSSSLPLVPQTGAVVPETLRAHVRERVLEASKQYSEKIEHESLRHAFLDVVSKLLPNLSTASSGNVPPLCEALLNPIRAIALPRLAAVQQRIRAKLTAAHGHCEGQPFIKAPYESESNGCFGKFNYTRLAERAEELQVFFKRQRSEWIEVGERCTLNGAYVASVLKDEALQLSENSEGSFCGGLVSEDNAFFWQLTLLPMDDDFEGSAYTVEIVFHTDPAVVPFVRFLQPIFHPNISLDGVPFITPSASSSTKTKHNPKHIVAELMKLLTRPPRREWNFNDDAWKLCFSADPKEQKEYKTRARRCARETME